MPEDPKKVFVADGVRVPGPPGVVAFEVQMPLRPVFVCPGCKEPCHFPTQLWDHRPPGEDPSERMSTCGCGMTHKLTMASGATSEVPAGATLDLGWRGKKDAAHRAAREAEHAEAVAEREASASRKAALAAEHKCVECGQALPKEGV